MSVSSYPTNQGKEVVIEISGRFDYRVHREFRAAYEPLAGVRHFRVDLRRVTFLDSSALGMLLLLRDHAGGDRRAVSIAATEPILQVFRATCFEELFEVDHNDGATLPGMAAKIGLP
jgi:anti-anti-sigma factor